MFQILTVLFKIQAAAFSKGQNRKNKNLNIKKCTISSITSLVINVSIRKTFKYCCIMTAGYKLKVF